MKNKSEILSEEKINDWIAKNRDSMIKDIINLVNIKSVKTEKEGKYPFGQGVGKALKHALSVASEYGLEVMNDDYYYGVIRYPGKEKEKIGIFAHLDVVPEGSGWVYEPYMATVQEGYIIGRGAGDNKGPAVASLYALKYLKENHVFLNKTIELYLGCAEEQGMEDIHYYIERNQLPCFSFTPDVAFPVCYAEKGILELEVQSILNISGKLKKLRGGIASNSVAQEAEAFVESPDDEMLKYLMQYSEVQVVEDGNGVKIRTEGIGKHAAFPEGSVNAIAVLCKTLADAPQLDEVSKRMCFNLTKCMEDYYGESLEIPYKDEMTGNLTHTCGLISMEGGQIKANFNIRYPVTTPRDEMKIKLNKIFEDRGFVITKYWDNPPMYVRPDSNEVQLLTRICNKNLKTELKPYTMGGGTYARKIPNMVGFGPGRNDILVKWGNGHEANECVSIENLEKAIKIYIEALIELDEIVK